MKTLRFVALLCASLLFFGTLVAATGKPAAATCQMTAEGVLDEDTGRVIIRFTCLGECPEKACESFDWMEDDGFYSQCTCGGQVMLEFPCTAWVRFDEDQQASFECHTLRCAGVCGELQVGPNPIPAGTPVCGC